MSEEFYEVAVEYIAREDFPERIGQLRKMCRNDQEQWFCDLLERGRRYYDQVRSAAQA